jgi:hypothetical protein
VLPLQDAKVKSGQFFIPALQFILTMRFGNLTVEGVTFRIADRVPV